MSLFKISNKVLKRLPAKAVKFEKEIQTLFENNLEEILNVTFLSSEYPISSGGRIDTLGIDNNGAPVIIEYKRAQNGSIINQGLYYLGWLLDHKADFQALVTKQKIKIDIDWDSPRVICIAESYNKFDLNAVELYTHKIELFKYRIYGQDLLFVEAEKQPKIHLTVPKAKGKGKQPFKEKTNYSVNKHLEIANTNTCRLFEALKEHIIVLDESIIEEPKAKYIAYKLTTNFVDVVIQKDSLKLFLNLPSGQLKDPKGLARDLSKPKKIGHWGNGDYEVKISHVKDIDAIIELIKQSYTYNK